VVSYLADNALTYAGGSALGFAVVTSEFKINYVRPAIGERLIARAEAVALSRSQVVCRCDVLAWRGGEEKLCAVAQARSREWPNADDDRSRDPARVLCGRAVHGRPRHRADRGR